MVEKSIKRKYLCSTSIVLQAQFLTPLDSFLLCFSFLSLPHQRSSRRSASSSSSSSSGGGFRSRSVGVGSSRSASSVAAKPAASATPARPQQQHPATPAPQQASAVPAPMQAPSGGGGMLSGIGGTIAQGMAFGTGSAIAHRAVDGIAGMFGGGGDKSVEQAAPQQQQQEPMSQMANQQNDMCAYDKQAFYTCLNENKNDQTTCNFLYDQLKQCQQNQSQFA